MTECKKAVKQLFAFLLVSAILISSLPFFAVAYTEKQAHINGTDVSLRTGAGTNNQRITLLSYNTKLTLTGEGYDKSGNLWYKVKVNSSGQTGYVISTYVSVDAESESSETPEIYESGVTGKVTDYTNVRSAPGTWNTRLVQLPVGAEVKIVGEEDDRDGDLWYKVSFDYGGQHYDGYIYSELVKVYKEYVTEEDFEAQLSKENFPESYKPYLRQLHAEYPGWIFVAKHLSSTFDEAVAGEGTPGKNTISSYEAWKSMESGCYNWSTNSYIVFDSGGWVTASRETLKYFLDPRSYLNDNNIFAFLAQEYSPTTDNVTDLRTMLKGTFMDGAVPDTTDYSDYAELIMEAAKESGVSPYVLAAKILVEQGTDGRGGSISGEVSGYSGYYNFFNINAYSHGGYDAVQYGLLYAKGSGSYRRPWNNRSDSLIGGAQIYGAEYINKGQNTLYFNKFNVVTREMYSHQYMTNVQGAASEATRLKKAFNDCANEEHVFIVPVYKNMPEEATPYPSITGNNNCYLNNLSVSGYSLTPSFDRYINGYEMVVEKDVSQITVNAVRSAGDSAVTGDGKVELQYGTNNVTVKVTSSSGKVNNYVINVFRKGSPSDESDPTLKTSYAVSNGNILIYENSEESTVLANLTVANGTAKFIHSVSSGTKAVTGDKVEIYTKDDKLFATYTLIIKGDINSDGRISISDLSLVHQQLLGSGTLTGSAKTAADITNDGEISILDLSKIHRHLLGIEKI